MNNPVEPTEIVDITETAPANEGAKAQPELIEEELLVEEISIDGMCGVY